MTYIATGSERKLSSTCTRRDAVAARQTLLPFFGLELQSKSISGYLGYSRGSDLPQCDEIGVRNERPNERSTLVKSKAVNGYIWLPMKKTTLLRHVQPHRDWYGGRLTLEDCRVNIQSLLPAYRDCSTVYFVRGANRSWRNCWSRFVSLVNISMRKLMSMAHGGAPRVMWPPLDLTTVCQYQ